MIPCRREGNVKKLFLTFAFALVLATAVAQSSCESSPNSVPGTVTPGTSNLPTLSAVASPTLSDDVDSDIRGLVLKNVGPAIKDVTIDHERYFTDSAGTTWIAFVVHPIPADSADLAIGVVRKVPGGEWEFVNLGTGPFGASVPADVKTALGLD